MAAMSSRRARSFSSLARSPEGSEVTVGPGTLVGELALLTNTVCHATAIAKEPTVVVRISRRLFPQGA